MGAAKKGEAKKVKAKKGKATHDSWLKGSGTLQRLKAEVYGEPVPQKVQKKHIKKTAQMKHTKKKKAEILFLKDIHMHQAVKKVNKKQSKKKHERKASKKAKKKVKNAKMSSQKHKGTKLHL